VSLYSVAQTTELGNPPLHAMVSNGRNRSVGVIDVLTGKAYALTSLPFDG
jgi:hypothetical protein